MDSLCVGAPMDRGWVALDAVSGWADGPKSGAWFRFRPSRAENHSATVSNFPSARASGLRTLHSPLELTYWCNACSQ